MNELHYRYGNFLTSGLHLLLLLVAARIATPIGWASCLALIGGISIFAWSANFRRSRAVADTPTSRVASAPQGYVELFGRAKPHPGMSMTSPVSMRPCVWFRYRIEEQSGNKWKEVGSGMSTDTFLLDDGTGTVVIDPDCAEIVVRDYRCWRDGRRRYTEWLFTPGGSLYALGELRTEGGSASELDTTRDMNALLADWKADKPSLLKRFDLDGNGQIDLKEWDLARRAALRDVRKAHQDILSQPGVNMMRKPRDGRLFLLADLDPNRLARRYGLWTWIQLVIAIGAGSGLLLLLTKFILR